MAWEKRLNGQASLQELYRQYGAFYPKGTVVIRQGEAGDHLYVVLSGAIEFSIVATTNDHRHSVRTAGPGELFGVTSCFTGLPHSATTKATVDSHLIRFRRETVGALVQSSPRFAVLIIEALVERLREATRRSLAARGRAAASRRPGPAGRATASAAEQPAAMPAADLLADLPAFEPAADVSSVQGPTPSADVPSASVP